MARISTYPLDANVQMTDTLLGSDEANPGIATKNFKISDVLALSEGGNGVYTKTVTITPAQLVAIDPADSATWIELVAAPGANKILHLLESAQGLIGATVSYSSNLGIRIGSAYPIVHPILTGTGTEYKCILGVGNNLMDVNTAMTLNTLVQESTGDGTFKLYLRYRIIDLS